MHAAHAEQGQADEVSPPQSDDLAQQQRVKCAFDPTQILNPGKVFPKLHRCAELGRVHVHKGEHRFPELPRF